MSMITRSNDNGGYNYDEENEVDEVGDDIEG
jgi:hypothetical protein